MSSKMELREEFVGKIKDTLPEEFKKQVSLFFNGLDVSDPKIIEDDRYKGGAEELSLHSFKRQKGLPTPEEEIGDIVARSEKLKKDIENERKAGRNKRFFEESFWRKIFDDVRSEEWISDELEEVQKFSEGFSNLFADMEKIEKKKESLRGQILEEVFRRSTAEAAKKPLENSKYQEFSGARLGVGMPIELDQVDLFLKEYDLFFEDQKAFKDVKAAFDEKGELVRQQTFLKDNVKCHTAVAHTQIFINALDESILAAEKNGAVMQQVVLKGAKGVLEKSKQNMLALKFDDPEFDKKLNAEAEKVLLAGEKMQSELKEEGFPGVLARAWNSVKSFFGSVLHIKTHRKLSKKGMGKAMVFGREQKSLPWKEELKQIEKKLSESKLPEVDKTLGKIKAQADEMQSASQRKKKK